MPKFDVLSDTHIDMWVKVNAPEYVQEKKIHTLIKKILPETPSPVLIIPGDIGHYVDQNIMFFRILMEYYKAVVWTHGNHDLYLVSKSVAHKYAHDSFSQLKEMIQLASELDGVYYLDGNIVTIQEVRIGGCSMWYDSSYGKEVHGFTEERIDALWAHTMNDFRLIYINSPGGTLDWRTYFKEQYAKMEKIHTEADILVSHVAPTWSNLLPKWHTPTSTFYHFDGSALLKNLNGKAWLHGHTHDNYDYLQKDGCHIICNALGYPESTNWETQTFPQKILTIEI